MFKKVTVLLLGAVLMTALMLAAGGIYLLPKNLMGAYMFAEVWDAVGGLFSFVLVPGFVVGYAACQSRVLGVIYYIGFLVLGFFGVIGKILSVAAIILNFVLMAALWIVPKDASSAFGAAVIHVKDFGATLFGVAVIFVFLPLFSVYSAKYSFIKPGLAKVLAVIFGGYDIMRGAFVTMPALLGGLNITMDTAMEGASPIFNNMFGIEACFLMAMLLGGILCVKTAFGKKLGLAAHFCLTKDGTASLRCLMMAALSAVLVFGAAPAAIFIMWLAAVVVLMLAFLMAYSVRPRYTYRDLRSMGYSDYEARKLLYISGGEINPV